MSIAILTSVYVILQYFQGNYYAVNVQTHILIEAIVAKSIRLLPQTFSTSICLRVEFVGCVLFDEQFSSPVGE